MPGEFDAYAAGYDEALNQGLALAGESKEYFAVERVRWLARCLTTLGLRVTRVLDFGCGTGSAGPELLRQLGATTVVGVDASVRILDEARRTHSDSRLQFRTLDEFVPCGTFDLAFCNGVFHHVVPEQRAGALATIHRSLSGQGCFAFWENNPWNPGTRLVMSRIPFDRDAQLISARHARALLNGAGFDVIRTDFLFIFPRQLAALRPIELTLTRFPVGAQYLVLCRKA
jgi:SAM-dependent methyltransferase